MTQTPVRQAGFWATMRAVMWSFLGIRKRRAYQEDAASLNVKAVIVAGVIGGLIFVLSIVAFVRFVVGA
jgi:hypothetical protein